MIRALLAAALLTLAPAAALAQSNPFEASGPADDAAAVEAGYLAASDAAAFSKQIERELAARGARVALVFRAGRSREDLPEGVRYTHGAFWVHTRFRTADGETLQGYAVYNLYVSPDDPAVSYLQQDLPLDFTRPMQVEQAGVIVPTPGVQARILAVMASADYEALHQPAYSLISNPHDLRFQNCNEFMLDVIASALWSTSDRAQLKSNLAAHFRPAELRTGLLQRLFAPMVDSRLKTQDHDGPIRTATFASIGAFMQENVYADAVFELDYATEG